MGMSSHVIGIVPPDDKWTQMKAAWDACKKAGVAPPKEVYEFFGGERPDPAGVVVEVGSCVKEWACRDASGFEVDLAKLPKHVKVLRFFNSY